MCGCVLCCSVYYTTILYYTQQRGGVFSFVGSYLAGQAFFCDRFGAAPIASVVLGR